MKKVLFLFLCGVLVLSGCVRQQPNTTSHESFVPDRGPQLQIYKNTFYGFSFSHSWDTKVQRPTSTGYETAGLEDTAILVSDPFHPNSTLHIDLVESVPKYTTLRDFLNKQFTIKNGLILPRNIAYDANLQYKVTSIDEFTVSGKPAIRIQAVVDGSFDQGASHEADIDFTYIEYQPKKIFRIDRELANFDGPQQVSDFLSAITFN